VRRVAVTAVVCASVVLASSGCFRTQYVNFVAPYQEPVAFNATPSGAPSSWQHYFLFGWIPASRTLKAGEACGGADRIQSIETRETFLQGFVAMLASYYVNIYSPYTGKVVCEDAKTP